MTREDFKAWLDTLDEEQQEFVHHAIAEAIFGDDFNDGDLVSEIRQHVYDCFPEDR